MALTRYRSRMCALGGVVEMRVNVEAADVSASPGPTTSEIRDRVVAARDILHHFPSAPSGAVSRGTLRLARTIAALDGRDLVTPQDRAEAMSYTTDI